MIIAIEGIDGAGKNTLVQHLRSALSVSVDVLSFHVMKIQFMLSLPRMLFMGAWGI